MRMRKHNRTAGFSLIEVMVGIAMLGLVTVPVCASLVLSVRLNSHAQSLMTAQLQAAGVVETLLAEGVVVDNEGNPKDWDPSDETDSESGVPLYWTTTIDGVDVKIELVDSTNYYKTEVRSTVNGETVTFNTTVRKGGG